MRERDFSSLCSLDAASRTWPLCRLLPHAKTWNFRYLRFLCFFIAPRPSYSHFFRSPFSIEFLSFISQNNWRNSWWLWEGRKEKEGDEGFTFCARIVNNFLNCPPFKPEKVCQVSLLSYPLFGTNTQNYANFLRTLKNVCRAMFHLQFTQNTVNYFFVKRSRWVLQMPFLFCPTKIALVVHSSNHQQSCSNVCSKTYFSCLQLWLLPIYFCLQVSCVCVFPTFLKLRLLEFWQILKPGWNLNLLNLLAGRVSQRHYSKTPPYFRAAPLKDGSFEFWWINPRSTDWLSIIRQIFFARIFCFSYRTNVRGWKPSFYLKIIATWA